MRWQCVLCVNVFLARFCVWHSKWTNFFHANAVNSIRLYLKFVFTEYISTLFSSKSTNCFLLDTRTNISLIQRYGRLLVWILSQFLFASANECTLLFLIVTIVSSHWLHCDLLRRYYSNSHQQVDWQTYTWYSGLESSPSWRTYIFHVHIPIQFIHSFIEHIKSLN